MKSSYLRGNVPRQLAVILGILASAAGVAFHPHAPADPLRFVVAPQDPTAKTSRRAFLQDSLGAQKDTSYLLRRAGPDSLRDTAIVADTARTEIVDSSARVEHFKHRRSDPVRADFFNQWTSPFYLKASPSVYRKEISLDSIGQIVTIRESVLGKDVKIPITMTLDRYIQDRLESEQRRRWQGLANEYRPTQQEGGLESVFGSFTNIDIPVPANPLLSIFGPPRINLKISGAVDIRAAFRSQKSDQTTISRFDQVRNEPDFNQEVQINVNGTIGDKLNILADWNTQRVFEYENQLKIKYTGYEDEIVQSVEAGNVSLTTPATFVGSSQALFGIKARFQTGPLMLTTLLSQKKGQTRELTVTGGAAKQTRRLKAYDYSKSHYFLDTLYRRFYDSLKVSITPTYTFEMQLNRVKDIEIWVSQPPGRQPDPAARQAVAFIDLQGLPAGQSYDSTLRGRQSDPGEIESNVFIKLKPGEFVLHEYEGYITINSGLDNTQVVAASYRIENNNTASSTDDIFFGEFTGNDTTRNTIVLKLVKPSNLIPSFRRAWAMMLKNIYSLGGRDLKKEGFLLKVLRTVNGVEDQEQIFGENLLSIFDLDRFDENNQPRRDNQFDFIPPSAGPGYTVDPARAEIVFPALEPFRANILRFFSSRGQPVDSSYLFPDVYDTTTFAASLNNTLDKYIIEVHYQAAQTTRYNLGFNLVEGSVRVLLNGAPLTPNIDYSVDYIIGEVVVRKAEALLPNANLQIKYEQNDLFQLAAKTLLGARGELALFQNTQLGFTAMNLNQQTLSDKVRLGEEPTNNTILGVDGSTSFSIAPLTAALDALPFYQTREMSTLRVSGEVAYMIPDPNTKKSPITSDLGEAVAYIDDFEGARRTIPLGVGYGAWAVASQPVSSYSGNDDVLKSLGSRAKLNWYNVLPSDVSVTQIWPNRSVRRGDERVTVLNLDFYPRLRGMYNFSANIDSTLLASPQQNWNGVMKYLSAIGANLLEQNVGFLEIWMKVEQADPADLVRGRLLVNLGAISEDVIPASVIPLPSRLPQLGPHSEDLVVNNIVNGTLQPGEDVGIDMLDDNQERAFFDSLVVAYPGLGGDPSGDNYSYATGSPDFNAFNGLEGNQATAAGLFPNTEDINGNFQLDNVNSYLEYEVPVDTVFIDSLGIQRTNPYIVGGGTSRWYQFRIPLVSPTRVMSRASQQPLDILQNLQFVRLFLSGFSQNVQIRIADINLVGNQWQELTSSDSVLKVSVVNIEDNPSYTSPPGVVRERDRTQPDDLVLANEQALSLILNNLSVDSLRQAVKNFSIRPLDVFNYRSAKMFVRGDPGFEFRDTSDYDAAIFLRFGSDTANFYEYREPLRPAVPGSTIPEHVWDLQNDITVNFADLASIKALRQIRGDSVNALSPPVPVEGKPGAEYRIRGNPTLTHIRAIWVGIMNTTSRRRPPGIARPLTGEVWINELRLIGVDDQPGLAYRFDTQLKLADLGDVSFNYSRIDPQFHGLEQRFGNRMTSVNWGISLSLGLEKFFPQSWQGTTVPFSYTHTENLVKPKYLPNTDVQVDEAASRASTPQAAENVRITAQTFRAGDSYSVPNLRIGFPNPPWYIRDTFNKMTFSFNYATARERSPVVEQRTSWAWTGRVSYAVTLPTDYYIEPFTKLFDGVFLLEEFKNWKLHYAPTTVSAGLGVNRSQARQVNRGVAAELPIARNFTASRSFGFGYKLTEGGLTNISGDYGLNIESNLIHLETDSLGNQRRFSQILGDIFFKDKFINLGNDGRYTQRFSASSRPKIPSFLDLNKYFDLSLGYSVSYSWQNNFQRGDLDKSAGWDNTITMTTNVRLKSLTDPWFQESAAATSDQPLRGPRRRTTELVNDTTARPPASGLAGDSTTLQEPEKEEGRGQNLQRLLKYAIKIPFLDYETINVSFTQSNRVGNSGVVGGPGFLNFWGRIPLFQNQVPEYGPTRLYQLGIISDPSGSLRIRSQSGFPFFGFDVERGTRAARASLTDQYGQTNRLSMRTSRALWEGASLDLNWNVGWTFSKSTTVLTDSLGIPNAAAVTTSGSVDRSFFTIPPVFLFKMFKSGLEDVGKKYAATRSDSTRPEAVKLAEAFEEGFEALPVLKKVFGRYFPRFNYSFRWDGLERLSAFSGYVDRLTLEHSYQSSFTRSWRGNPDGGERTDAERVSYGFAPLLGASATMKELLKGNISANIRYNTSTSYDLNISARNIVETFSQEISFSLSYMRRGFEFLLFGVSLSNDLEFGMTYSRTKNSRRTYDVGALETSPDGIPLEGSTRTVLEPRIRYVLSSRVTASIFYRYTKVAPDEGGSVIPGTTTNEAGLDIHIAIQ